MAKKPAGLDDIIAPFSRDRFLAEHWGQKFLYQQGIAGRFTPLLPWETLNAILQWHSPPQPQIRLFQENKMVDVRRYIDGPVGALRLNPGGLIAALSQGASMIVDAVHEVVPDVRELLQSLEDDLQAKTIANLYAGWRPQQAFDLHWDPHEVIVLQLSGRKHWKVYGPTRAFPLGDDIEKGPPANDQPVFDGVLNDGDMLYIPRGWWHMAVPLDGPSLHLSIGLEPPTGQDFLHWLGRQMLRHPQVRQNVPTDAAERSAYFAQLAQLFGRETATDPLTRFLGERSAARRVPPRLNLPSGPLDQKKPADRTTSYRLASADHLFIETGERMARFVAGGVDYSLAPELAPALRKLSGRQGITLEALSAGITSQQALVLLVGALETLASAGIVLKE